MKDDNDEKSFTDFPSPAMNEEKQMPPDEPEIRDSEPLLDLESQKLHDKAVQEGTPVAVTGRATTMLYLGTYFFINLGLTFYNKAVMGAVCHSP